MSQSNPLKITVIGRHGVGKTTIIRRFVREHIDTHKQLDAQSHLEANQEYVPTIGLDFECGDIDVDGEKVALQIWDTVNSFPLKC
jgi:GTPase SAR1 family protein